MLTAQQIVHQIFRLYESYSPPVHAVLLLGAPTLVAAYLTSWFSTGDFPKTFTMCLLIHLLTLVSVSMLIPAYMAIRGNLNVDIMALHDRYGDVIRTWYNHARLIGPNELHVRDPSILSSLWAIPRGPSFIGVSLSQTKVPMAGIRDPEEHQGRRRPWNRGLAPGALREYDHLITMRVQQLVRRLEEQVGEVILGKWFYYFSYDLMCDMTFGGGSELLRDGEEDNFWSILEKGSCNFAVFFSRVPWLGPYVGYIPGAGRALGVLQSRCRKFTMKRIHRGSNTRDLFYYLNNEDLPNRPPPPTSDLIDDGILAIVAGSDTTAVALTNLFYCVLTDPEVFPTLQGEGDKFYPFGEDAFNSKCHRDMVYLQAVINETLRLFPPLPTGAQRQVPAHAAPVVAGNLHIPPGTIVWIHPYSVQRNARSFTLPEVFWPERWLVASGKDFVHNEDAFVPFSHGPWNCVGRGLALQEVHTVVCALLQRFEFKLRPGWDPKEFERGMKCYVSTGRPALPVVLRPRI
ncbi:high nitrogen upregulated cytochrome P450 monooxygenase 2 [Ganoderma leucocontextum]|nr:high nitrogen upregulated cytochrome P450 monooxygenase 2 [Ganoderma leucocontextum]